MHRNIAREISHKLKTHELSHFGTNTSKIYETVLHPLVIVVLI